MKKLMLLSMIFSFLFGYSQQNDTIFYENGEIENVYKIRGVENGKLWYYFKKDYSLNGLDTILIKKYSKQTNDYCEKKEFTNKKVLIIKDTIINTKKLIEDTISTGIDKNKVNPYEIKNSVYELEGKYYEKNYNKSNIDYKTGWIQYNLKKFYKEERLSQIFYGLSITTSFATSIATLVNIESKSMNIKTSKLIGTAGVLSGGLGLIGFVLHLHSYEWIKKASMETSLNELKVKINL